MKRTVVTLFSTLLLSAMLFSVGFSFNIRIVKGYSETIYIRANGSVYPTTAPIQRNGDTYSLVGSIIFDMIGQYARGISIEKDNVILDGAGYTIQSTTGYGRGVFLDETKNVTVRNTHIEHFALGIHLNFSSGNSIHGNNFVETSEGYLPSDCILLWSSSNNSISENIIGDCDFGINVRESSDYNTISGNNITSVHMGAIAIYLSSYNKIGGNILTANSVGIDLSDKYNTVIENNITDCDSWGILVREETENNLIYHNNLIRNHIQVENSSLKGHVNSWDNGSEGNYWSDYLARYPDAEEIGITGTWTPPYVIDSNNQDRYPLMEPLKIRRIPEFPLINGQTTSQKGFLGTGLQMEYGYAIVGVIAVAIVTTIGYLLLKRRK